MKKTYIAGLALAFSLFGAPAVAQEYAPSATSEIYDFAGFSDSNLLDLFYKALQNGRNYPTMEEFEAAGIQASDIAFVRSHVRRAEIMDRSDRLVEDTYEKRNLWMNIPMDVGSGGDAGYPGTKFAADVYSMWQYTNLFGSWNHSIFQAPGCWVDAAHRNGTKIFSGIKFFESWTAGSGDGEYSALITKKDANGDYMYIKPLINCLMFFGSDGINYNWEDYSYADSDIIAFHKALYKYAEEVGFTDYNSGIYTSVSGMNASNVEALHGSTAKGRTHTTMLNYANGDFSYQIAQSVQAAETALGTSENLYTGVWIVSMDRGWNRLNNGDAKRAGLCLWGEHGQSRFMSYNTGSDAFDTQGNYQRLLERGFSGGYRNPASRPAVSNTGNNWELDGDKLPLSTFAGLASWIPERSAIQGNLPFATHFTLGNGDRYYYKGKRTAGSWYNMGAQDIVPTYRWLVYKANTTEVSSDVAINYTHLDAYTGGSCIELTGAATAEGTDIVLYKTNLKVSGQYPIARLAVKTAIAETTPSNLYLIVRTAGSEEWQEYAYGDVAGASWEEKELDLASLATGDVIDRIGLRVKGDNENYKLLVGKLEINDNSVVAPASVKDVVVEVKEETKGSMSMKLHWDVEAQAQARADWGLVYNDEANISHFEILYKNGEEGKVALVGTTSQWATFIGGIYFDSVDDQPYVGVRSVSTDLKSYSPVVWVKVPRAAQSELPELVEEDTYGVSAMDPNCEGAAIARQQRYVTSIVTEGAEQNLNYTADGPVADGSQYADVRHMTLGVKQGQTVTMTIKCADFSDGLKYCFAGGWLDLNGSGDFDDPLPMPGTLGSEGEETSPTGERLFKAGKIRAASPEFQGKGITFDFTVPEDATPGNSRFRIVFSDAWFAGMFLPTGLHAKGFSMDFNAVITGDNPGRAAEDTRDQGEAEEPELLEGGTTSVEEAVSEVSKASVVGDVIYLSNVEKAWVYSADGRLVEYVKGVSTVDASSYASGVYLVKMINGNVIRSAKVVIK